MLDKAPWLGCATMVILIIGGLNWLLVGLFSFNLITAIFGGLPILVRLIYIIVGLSAIFWIYKSACKCKSKGGSCSM